MNIAHWFRKPVSKEQARDAEWHYLTSENARARYALASSYISHLPRILEIGAYKTPIDQFLPPGAATQWVRVVDPIMSAYEGRLDLKSSCRVEHVPAMYQDVDYQEFTQEKYALILIGCSLKFKKKDAGDKARALEVLRDLLSKAEVVVYEYAAKWPNAIENAQFVEGILGKPKVDLELNIGRGLKMDAEIAQRRFQVYQK